MDGNQDKNSTGENQDETDEDRNKGREFTREILLILYQEEVNQARHHETLRAQGATVLFAILASLLTLAGALITFDKDGTIKEYVIVALGVTMVLLAGLGAALSRKHFERAEHNFSRANAYKDCLLALVTEAEVKAMYPEEKRGERLPKIGALLKEAEAAIEEKRPGQRQKIRALDRDPQKDKKLNPVDLTDEKYLPQNLNPLIQEVYVTPLENMKHTWLWMNLGQPIFDLFKIWDCLYLFMAVAGAIVAIYALN